MIASDFAPLWIAGTAALDHMLSVYPQKDERTRFEWLQTAIRERTVKGRARGKDADREFYVEKGLASDPDFVEAVDGPWRREFILRDAATVDVAVFREHTEVLREDLLECFPCEDDQSRYCPEEPIAETKGSRPNVLNRAVETSIMSASPHNHGTNESAKFPKRKRRRSSPQTEAARKAIDALYPEGPPSQAEVPNKILCAKVREKLGDGRKISDDVIRSAAGRK